MDSKHTMDVDEDGIMQLKFRCGCIVEVGWIGDDLEQYHMIHCSVHAAAPDMAARIAELEAVLAELDIKLNEEIAITESEMYKTLFTVSSDEVSAKIRTLQMVKRWLDKKQAALSRMRGEEA